MANSPTVSDLIGRPVPGFFSGGRLRSFAGSGAGLSDGFPIPSQFPLPSLSLSRTMRGPFNMKRLTCMSFEIRGRSFTLTSKDFTVTKSFSLKPEGFPRWRSEKDSPTQGNRERLISPPKVKGRPAASATFFSISGLYFWTSINMGMMTRAAMTSTMKPPPIIAVHLIAFFITHLR